MYAFGGKLIYVKGLMWMDHGKILISSIKSLSKWRWKSLNKEFEFWNRWAWFIMCTTNEHFIYIHFVEDLGGDSSLLHFLLIWAYIQHCQKIDNVNIWGSCHTLTDMISQVNELYRMTIHHYHPRLSQNLQGHVTRLQIMMIMHHPCVD